jgi:hypothetical protein
MKYIKILSIVAIAIFSQSCAGILNPELKQVKLKSEWLTPSPHIRPVSGSQKLVYLSIRNTSGSSIDIRNQIRSKVEGLGYRVTDDLTTAKFILMADIRYFGEKSEKGYSNTVGGAVLGGLAGGLGSAALSKKNRGRNAVIGGVGGAVVGGLIGNVVDGYNKVTTFDIVVDLRIGEKIEGGVTTNVNSNSKRGLASNTKSATTENSFESGKSTASSSESTSFKRREDFVYHEARLVCSATKINLTEIEAEQPLQSRLTNSIGQLLP